MKVEIFHQRKRFLADFSKPIDISIPLTEGESNPNCYYAEPVVFETITSGDFIGSVAQGGSVNYQKLTITPHGNGTHTECYGHISPDKSITINQCLKEFHFIAQLITAEPETNNAGDRVIKRGEIEQKLSAGIKAVIIRTLPNPAGKKLARYSNTNPPYLSQDAAELLVLHGVEHLLIDLPSVDREVDQGVLAAHKTYWTYPSSPRKHATITELIYVPASVADGIFLLNLQITSLEMDASPSKPLLFKLEEVS